MKICFYGILVNICVKFDKPIRYQVTDACGMSFYEKNKILNFYMHNFIITIDLGY